MKRAAEPGLICCDRRREPVVEVCARVWSAFGPMAAGVLLGVGVCVGLCTVSAGAQSRDAAAASPRSGARAGAAVSNPHAANQGQDPPGFEQFTYGSRLRPVDFVVRWGTPAAEPETVRVPRRAGSHTAWHDPTTGLLHHQYRGYREPGVRALVGRPQYVALVGPDGEIAPGSPRIEVAGANTVFQLTPERRAQAPRRTRPTPPGLLNTKLNLRMAQPDGTRQIDERLGSFTPLPVTRRRVRNGPATGAAPPAAVPARAVGVPAEAHAEADADTEGESGSDTAAEPAAVPEADDAPSPEA